MSIASPTPAGQANVISASAPASAGTSLDSSVALLVQCLTVECGAASTRVEESVQRLRDTGGSIFEAVVGAPLARYGPRLTLNAGPEPRDQAERLGFADHPWGPPTWYGLRLGPSTGAPWNGAIRIKPYHRMHTPPAGVRLPAGLPDALGVELAARDGDRTEVYFRRTVAGAWLPFAQAALALVGAPIPDFPLAPRAVTGAHCLSLSWTGDRLTAVTIYAQDRCLPDDRSITAAWLPGLDAVDRRTYEAALGGVRSWGRPGTKSYHGLLSWSATADGSSSRAVSLRVHDPLGREPAPLGT